MPTYPVQQRPQVCGVAEHGSRFKAAQSVGVTAEQLIDETKEAAWFAMAKAKLWSDTLYAR
jgi:hypothetical protein